MMPWLLTDGKRLHCHRIEIIGMFRAGRLETSLLFHIRRGNQEWLGSFQNFDKNARSSTKEPIKNFRNELVRRCPSFPLNFPFLEFGNRQQT